MLSRTPNGVIPQVNKFKTPMVLGDGLTFQLDNIGAILAVADWQSRVSLSIGQKPLTMEAVLLALVKAYEIQGCFQVHSELNKAGFDHTILVKVASTAAVSWLLDLSENQTLDALSLAWMDGTPLRVYRQPPNVGSRKGWAAGDACMRAVHLALLTKNGQPGAPTVLTASRWGFYDTLFEGQHFRLPRPLGSWVIESIFFKIHAAEGHAASGVEAALELCEQLRVHNLSPERDIMHIQVRTQHAAKIAMDKQGRLHNSADRDHCMQYMIAVILLKGYTICAADYQNDSPWARDPRVEDLRKRIDLVEDQQFTAENHDSLKQSASNALKVTLRDGVDLNEVVVEYPAGHPWREDAVKMVKTKFEKNVVKWFDKDEQDVVLKLASSNVEEFKKLTVCEFVDTFFKQ